MPVAAPAASAPVAAQRSPSDRPQPRIARQRRDALRVELPKQVVPRPHQERRPADRSPMRHLAQTGARSATAAPVCRTTTRRCTCCRSACRSRGRTS
jgi:hypothetical protein